MKYIVRINNKEYEVEVERGRANLLKTVEVSPLNPELEPVVVMPVPSAVPSAANAVPSTAVAAGEPVKSPMPGSILDIKTGAGSLVKKGDVLLILEAMKMENEIRAPRDGKIAQVIVTKGASVATDDILLILQ